MSSASAAATRDPDVPSGDVRQRVSAAARDLFATQGYEQTTVDAIAERAGVARRTFFRHFRSKDDAIFPDHARIAAGIEAHLAALQDVPALTALGIGVRIVFRSYVDDPVVSVERYRLTRSFPALRDREIASVSRYTRLFARFLHQRFPDTAGAGLWAEACAAAYVAAHNHVLREWLRAAGEVDPMPALDAAFEWVEARFAADLPGALPSAAPAPAVLRTGEPVADVVQRLPRSL